MLYATTRSQNDVFTAYKAIHTDTAPDGGLYLPFRLPQWDREEIKALAQNTACQNMANVINGFFSCGLSGWDIEFAIGRNPVQMASVNHRVLIAECWHNAAWRFDHAVQTLSDLIRKEGVGEPATGWMKIAVSIAYLFGIYGEYLKTDEELLYTPVDVAVTTGTFVLPMACWYARQMGLPLGNIICGCNQNGSIWDLLHRGEMPTGNTAVKTLAPDCDIVVPRQLERLIHGTLGVQQTMKFLSCCQRGGLYAPLPEDLEKLRKGMFASVISDSRIRSLIPSVYRTGSYVFGPYDILAYGSLMDYRAKTGESRRAILLSECSPICDGELVAECLGVSVPELQKKLA